MKKIVYTIIIFLFINCDSENGSDCFKKEGAIVRRELDVAQFNEIIVFERVQLFIEEGPIQKIILESGENLIDNVEIAVEGAQLILKDNNACNYVRDYDITKVYITSPNLTSIRNSSSFEVTSIGVLSFPKLALYSENFENENIYRADGDFKLSLNVDVVKVFSTGYSTIRLDGIANKAEFNLYSGDTRIFADNLLINNLFLFHRSSNRMIVNPIASIQGKIVSVGDVIAKNRPLIVDVEELYTGTIIWEE